MNGMSSFEIALDPDVRELARMRRMVSDQLQARDMEASVVDDLLLVVSELCTNAIQATADGPDPIVVRVDLTHEAVAVEVANVGASFLVLPVSPQPSAEAERGRGLDIVRSLADAVTLHHKDGRSIVRAVIPLA